MKKIYILVVAFLALTSCGNKQKNGNNARENYVAALTDSITKIKSEIDSCNANAALLGDKVSQQLINFTAVNNPREVEGYTIYNGWSGRYPLTATGLITRITTSEQLELIAALSNGVFDRIRVIAPNCTAESDVVNHDHALNYRRDGLTTVRFSGKQADEVVRLIADNELNNVEILFLNGGKQTGKWMIPADYKKQISETWLLYANRSEQTRLERRAVMLGQKLNLLRSHLDNSRPESDTESED